MTRLTDIRCCVQHQPREMAEFPKIAVPPLAKWNFFPRPTLFAGISKEINMSKKHDDRAASGINQPDLQSLLEKVGDGLKPVHSKADPSNRLCELNNGVPK